MVLSPSGFLAFLHVEDGYWGDSVLHGSRRLTRLTQVLSLQRLQLGELYVPAVATSTCGLAGMTTRGTVVFWCRWHHLSGTSDRSGDLCGTMFHVARLCLCLQIFDVR